MTLGSLNIIPKQKEQGKKMDFLKIKNLGLSKDFIIKEAVHRWENFYKAYILIRTCIKKYEEFFQFSTIKKAILNELKMWIGISPNKIYNHTKDVL